MNFEEQQGSGRANAMASDVAALPEGEVIAFCAALDARLQETAGIGLSQIASYIDSQQGQQQQEMEEEGPVMYQEDANTFSPEAPAEAMPTSRRQRITLR